MIIGNALVHRVATMCQYIWAYVHCTLCSQVPQLTEVSWVYNTLKTVKFCEVATDFVDSSGGLHKIGGALM